MRVTIHEVARQAGVSISTVSRVLNNTCPVNEEKRKRVEKAAEALGYTPNPAARSLLKRETGGLGVLLPFVGGEFFSGLLNGIDRASQESDYFLLISTSHRNDRELKKAYRGMAKRVDGLLIMAPSIESGGVERLLHMDVPVVFLNTKVSGEKCDAFLFDNAGGCKLIARHLIELGHRRIAYIRGPERAFDANERLEGYLTVMASAGLDPLVFEGEYSQEAGYRVAREILTRKPRPTAIIGANDYCAIGALRAIREHGLSVPGVISVAGFDDVLSSSYASPPLTTVRVPVAEMGSQAIERLIDAIRGQVGNRPEQKVFPVKLMIRESTGPAHRGS